MSVCHIPVFISRVVFLGLSRGQGFPLNAAALGRTELGFLFCGVGEQGVGMQWPCLEVVPS